MQRLPLKHLHDHRTSCVPPPGLAPNRKHCKTQDVQHRVLDQSVCHLRAGRWCVEESEKFEELKKFFCVSDFRLQAWKVGHKSPPHRFLAHTTWHLKLSYLRWLFNTSKIDGCGRVQHATLDWSLWHKAWYTFSWSFSWCSVLLRRHTGMYANDEAWLYLHDLLIVCQSGLYIHMVWVCVLKTQQSTDSRQIVWDSSRLVRHINQIVTALCGCRAGVWLLQYFFCAQREGITRWGLRQFIARLWSICLSCLYSHLVWSVVLWYNSQEQLVGTNDRDTSWIVLHSNPAVIVLCGYRLIDWVVAISWCQTYLEACMECIILLCSDLCIYGWQKACQAITWCARSNVSVENTSDIHTAQSTDSKSGDTIICLHHTRVLLPSW